MHKLSLTKYPTRIFILIAISGLLLSIFNLSYGQLNVGFNASSTEVCTGARVTFTNLSSGTSENSSYIWNFGAGASPRSSNSAGPITVTYNTAGLKTVVLEIIENGESQIETKENYVEVFEVPIANAGFGGETCSDYFALSASTNVGSGYWNPVSNPENFEFIPSNSDPNAIVSVEEYGTHNFTWTVENGVCSSSETIAVTFRQIPAVNAGKDSIICTGNSIQLDANGSGDFLWNPDTIFNDNAISNPLVTPTETTVLTLRLTDQFGCVNYDDLTVTVRNPPIPNAGNDQELYHEFITDLDAKVENDFETGFWSLMEGEGIISDSLNPETMVTELSLGLNKFLWTVSNEVCPTTVDSVSIIVNDLLVPTLITPNNDGKNDFLILNSIEELGQTELIVFDRNGTIVYSTKNYNNNWNGIDNSGNNLPGNTYFLMIKTEHGRKISSFIVIRR